MTVRRTIIQRTAELAGLAIRNVTDELDNEIGQLLGGTPHVTVLDERNLFAGHELCTSQPWVNGIEGLGAQDSLHPTATGYQHWAQALASYLG